MLSTGTRDLYPEQRRRVEPRRQREREERGSEGEGTERRGLVMTTKGGNLGWGDAAVGVEESEGEEKKG